jgi:glycosyltransferase involved in cell wall biosynthesis
MIRVLYLYDHPDWALHNVGLLWADLLRDTHHFEFVALGAHRALSPAAFDFVLFGCTLMTERHLRVKHLLARLGLYRSRWLPVVNTNFVSVVHDPCELFPQRPDWQTARPCLVRLGHYARLAVISNEMQGILATLGWRCLKINTTSRLQLASAEGLVPAPLAIVSRANPVPRKNIDLFHRLQQQSNGLTERFDGFFDRKILPSMEYLQLLDRYNCYLCTSWQEGGPLPVIDAIHRGCAVLTTPVGQTDEWVEHGGNGFFCTSEQEFMGHIRWLASHPEGLLACRQRSLAIAARDMRGRMRSQLQAFLCPGPV